MKGVSSNPVEGEQNVYQMKNLILRLLIYLMDICNLYIDIYVLPLETSCQEWEGWDPIDRLTPSHFFACLKPGPRFPTSQVIVHLLILAELLTHNIIK